MKVKFIKKQLDKNYRGYPRGTGFDDIMDIGEGFFVYGLQFIDNEISIFIYIYPKMDQLVWIPLELFEIIDDKIPGCWRVQQGYGESIYFFPDIFFSERFLENFSDSEPRERAEFEAFRKIYEK